MVLFTLDNISLIVVISDTFLQINDQINTVLNRYEAFKRGDYATLSNPLPAELSSAKTDLSLIDFDDGGSQSAVSLGTDTGDLAGLFGSSSSTSPPGMMGRSGGPGIAMGAGMSTTSMSPAMGMGTMASSIPTHAPSPMPFNGNGYGVGAGIGLGRGPGGPPTVNNATKPISMSPPRAVPTPPGSIMLPMTPSLPATTNYFANGGNVGTSNVVAGSGTQPASHPASQLQAQQQPASGQVPRKDPFADLAGLF